MSKIYSRKDTILRWLLFIVIVLVLLGIELLWAMFMGDV